MGKTGKSKSAAADSPERMRVEALRKELFANGAASATAVYAILDGASCPELLSRLEKHDGEHGCLYGGDLAPDALKRSPFLVRLEAKSPLTDWLLSNWGSHFGIYAAGPADFALVRQHLRTFLMVRDPKGQHLFFRYYDPRVFRVYLPTCNEEEAAYVFGPLESYALEDEEPGTVLTFTRKQRPLKVDRVRLP